MYGSEAAARFAYDQTKNLPAVQAAVGSRIKNLTAVPQGLALPAALHYMETGMYSGGVGGDPDSEEVRYVYRFICSGESNQPIKAAALAMFNALKAASGSVVIDGESWFVTFLSFGEWPLTSLIEGGTMYRQLGNYFTVEVMKQGV